MNCMYCTSEGLILERNPDKSLQSFPPCYSQSPVQFCLETYISSNSRKLLQFPVTVHCKGEGGKSDRKPYHLPYGLRNPYRNLNSKNSQDYAQKRQQNCTFMNSASILILF
jgi:hypothetical protein